MIQRPQDRGASSVEYALLASAIAAVIAAVVLLFGGRVTDLFQHTCDQVSKATSSTCATAH